MGLFEGLRVAVKAPLLDLVACHIKNVFRSFVVIIQIFTHSWILSALPCKCYSDLHRFLPPP